jgi:hypothetical protein
MKAQIRDGQKNVRLVIKGIALKDLEPTPILDIRKLMVPPGGWKGLRLDSAVWTVQEKMGLALWWSNPAEEGDLVFPMESRNSVRFDEGLSSPRIEEGWSGILYLSSFNVEGAPSPKRFFVLLDFDKQ